MSPRRLPVKPPRKLVTRDKICSERRANVSGSFVTRMFSHPGRQADYYVARDISPSLAIALGLKTTSYSSNPNHLVYTCHETLFLSRTTLQGTYM